jgi:hypothetical protein
MSSLFTLERDLNTLMTQAISDEEKCIHNKATKKDVIYSHIYLYDL